MVLKKRHQITSTQKGVKTLFEANLLCIWKKCFRVYPTKTDPEEEALLKEMERHKEVYSYATNSLRKVSSE